MEHASLSSRARARLGASDGFTLGEVLATVVLVGLLTLAIAAGIGVAVNAYGDIRGHSDEQAVLNNAVTAVADELRFAYDVNATDPDRIVFSSTNRDTRLYLGNNAEKGNAVTLYGMTAPDGKDPQQDVRLGDPVPLPLVDTAAGISGGNKLVATLSNLAYNNGTWTFAITVTGGSRPLQSESITVRSINTW
ncbi:PulJ/GspJ family protein [Arabiibacter massiliensis]|uniref:PulJ/GspJ family protein n=1 Tax=Arabiibacter massiliensis TaxID=1870985 RepID=UPI0009BC1BCD|nr:hypothetical protein [Arabiibacter massiliensis]